MKSVYCNLETYNYDVDITVDEWKEILCLPAVHNAPKILDSLAKWYFAYNYTASCTELANQYGCKQQHFSVQNRRLGEIAVNYLGRFRLIGNDGKETYWAIAWIYMNPPKRPYIVQLRPELVEAIKQLNLFS